MKMEENDDVIVGLNIAPLVDVVLVLLIIFMATAPLIQRRTLDVSVPKVATSEAKATETLNITIDKQGQIFLAENPITPSELDTQIKMLFKADPYLHVSVQADEAVPYGIVAQVLDSVKGAGVKKLGLEVGRKVIKK